MDIKIMSEIEYAQCDARELESLAQVLEDSFYNGINDKKNFEGTISILVRLLEKHKSHLDKIVETMELKKVM